MSQKINVGRAKTALYGRFLLIFAVITVFGLSHLLLLSLFLRIDSIKPPETVLLKENHKFKTYLDQLASFIDWNSIPNPTVDKVLLSHLQNYNSSLPTNYSPWWGGAFLKKQWKRTMPKYILNRLHGKTGGFFVECGAFDGEFISNTVMLEKHHNWTGLLIEADPGATKILKERNRKAWVADVCLSPEPHPMKINMTGASRSIGHGYIQNNVIASERTNKQTYNRKFQVLCYPLHMLLNAIGRTYVDYFSLDVEGVEFDILKTIPWDRIKIQLISVEIRPENKDDIRRYLESVGYKQIHQVVEPSDFIHDHVYELIDTDKDEIPGLQSVKPYVSIPGDEITLRIT